MSSKPGPGDGFQTYVLVWADIGQYRGGHLVILEGR